MGRYIEDAWALYGHAVGELEEWRRTGDDVLLRDAAEKAWGAVTLAANELLESQGRVVPDGTNARRDGLRALERNDGRIRALRFQARFLAAKNILHQDCFYDGQCPTELVVEVVTDDAREYLGDVVGVANGAG
jgi:hypothetical protein